MACPKSPEQNICYICGDDQNMEHFCPYNHIFGRYFSYTCRGEECPPGEHRITPRGPRKFLRRFVRVSNLPPGFRVWELEGLFGPFGPLLMWDVPRFPGDMCCCRTENRMSFGYAVFKKREDGKRAIDELNGSIHAECALGEHRISRGPRKFLRYFIRVSNLPPGFREWDLESLFSPFGPLLMWDVPTFDNEICGCTTEIRMSLGYVVFKKREDGKRAINELNGYEALGHKLRVDWVYPSCV
ncbi:hypothetical protein C2845_PM03G03240 [Panicum miliaceum]|uniref:RRM domain-containing protein n=1 Tax=Panicum miliaceum TaxID=4540 RepID=A0A3L6T3M4_PANMI|nr:hypothetical protein C2845_PM03G03240 [Panicum miliaceum]